MTTQTQTPTAGDQLALQGAPDAAPAAAPATTKKSTAAQPAAVAVRVLVGTLVHDDVAYSADAPTRAARTVTLPVDVARRLLAEGAVELAVDAE